MLRLIISYESFENSNSSFKMCLRTDIIYDSFIAYVKSDIWKIHIFLQNINAPGLHFLKMSTSNFWEKWLYIIRDNTQISYIIISEKNSLEWGTRYLFLIMATNWCFIYLQSCYTSQVYYLLHRIAVLFQGLSWSHG